MLSRSRGAKDIGAQPDAVVHRDRHVPIDLHAQRLILSKSSGSLEAVEAEEIGRIDEHLSRRSEAGLAAELAPYRPGLGKVAGGDVVPDLVPFVGRQYAPPGLVRV